MRSKAELRAVLARKAETDPVLDILLRLRAVEKHPDGQHLVLWLDPKDTPSDEVCRALEERSGATLH